MSQRRRRNEVRESEAEGWEWEGRQVVTIGDLSAAVLDIAEHGTREDAERFMAAYRSVTVHAATNVGYLAGYRGTETAQRIWDWFQCAHPIFGTYLPTSDEALDAGRRWMSEQL